MRHARHRARFANRRPRPLREGLPGGGRARPRTGARAHVRVRPSSARGTPVGRAAQVRGAVRKCTQTQCTRALTTLTARPARAAFEFFFPHATPRRHYSSSLPAGGRCARKLQASRDPPRLARARDRSPGPLSLAALRRGSAAPEAREAQGPAAARVAVRYAHVREAPSRARTRAVPGRACARRGRGGFAATYARARGPREGCAPSPQACLPRARAINRRGARTLWRSGKGDCRRARGASARPNPYAPSARPCAPSVRAREPSRRGGACEGGDTLLATHVSVHTAHGRSGAGNGRSHRHRRRRPSLVAVAACARLTVASASPSTPNALPCSPPAQRARRTALGPPRAPPAASGSGSILDRNSAATTAGARARSPPAHRRRRRGREMTTTATMMNKGKDVGVEQGARGRVPAPLYPRSSVNVRHASSAAAGVSLSRARGHRAVRTPEAPVLAPAPVRRRLRLCVVCVDPLLPPFPLRRPPGRATARFRERCAVCGVWRRRAR